MATTPPRLLLASCTGLAFTSAFVGLSWTLSYIAIPSLLIGPPRFKANDSAHTSQPRRAVSSPGLLARQYQLVYDIGATVGPITGVISAATFTYASQLLPAAARTSRYLLIAAAVLNISVAPFTATVMAKANIELQRRAGAAERGEDGATEGKDAVKSSVEGYDTPSLLQWWANLNALRGWIQVAALACATTALVI